MPENPEGWKERSNRLERAQTWLVEERGWMLDDASAYLSYHHIWMNDELHPKEQERAEAIEKKYGVPPHFMILNEIPPVSLDDQPEPNDG